MNPSTPAPAATTSAPPGQSPAITSAIQSYKQSNPQAVQPSAGGNSWYSSVKAGAYRPATVTPKTQNSDVNADQATFPANGSENPLEIAGKTIGNIPASAYNFGKNTIKFFNPLNTLKNIQSLKRGITDYGNDTGGAVVTPADLAKEIPGQAEKMLVPKFLQHIFSGNLNDAAATLENDPVGQILPLLMVARSAAQAGGMGDSFDNAVSATASPITKSASYATSKVGSAVGNVGAQVLGAATGTGASSVKTAFTGGKAFTDAMRGNTSPEDLVGNVQDAVQSIADQRRADYQAKLGQIKEGEQYQHDFSPIQQASSKALLDFGITQDKEGLNFDDSKFGSATDQNKVASIIKDVKAWAADPKKQTTLGLDTLKQRIDNYVTPDTKIGAFANAIKNSVRTELNNAPGYKEMTSDYAKTSSLLDDIKSATGAGGNAKVDTVFSKLTTAMKGDKELRLQILDKLQNNSGNKDLMEQIAGTNMQSLIPKGLVGRGADIGALTGTLLHAFNPEVIPLLLTTSPRVVGEFVHALGLGAEKTSNILNAVNGITDKGGIPAVNAMMKKNDIQPGLSTKNVGPDPLSVAKKIGGADIPIIQDFVNHPSMNNYMKLQPIFDGEKGLDDLPLNTLQRFFQDVIQERNAPDFGEKTFVQDTKSGKMKGSK